MENKKYSLLVVALYCYLGHVKAVIEHLKKRNPLVDVTILTEKADEVRKALPDDSIKIIHYDVKPIYIKQRWLRFLIIRHKQRKFFSTFCKNRRYDIVNIHFANRFMWFVYKYLRVMSKNIVVTPWGSDILRLKYDKAIEQIGKLYRKADYIATDVNTPLGKRIIEDLKAPQSKFVGNFFGSDVIDYAIKHGDSISQEEAKERFGLKDRYIITCGYNKREVHRHKEMIEAIGKVRNELPNNLTLLFPMTYGPNTRDEYVTECEEECKKRNIPAVFVTEFLSVEDLYKLRKATDMFIHLQLTDASSGSVQEYILCDKKIVHGAWVKYEELESYKPLFYFPVNKMEDLGTAIVKTYKSEKIDIPQGIINYVKNSGWESKAVKMNDFFMSIV